jgi:hypothetical protein
MNLLIEIEQALYASFVLRRDPKTIWLADLYRELAVDQMAAYARGIPRRSVKSSTAL